MDQRETDVRMSEYAISVLSWALAVSSCAVSPSVPPSAPVGPNSFLEDPHFKTLCFSARCGYGYYGLLQTLIHQKRSLLLRTWTCSIRSPLHLTLPDVLICDPPKASSSNHRLTIQQQCLLLVASLPSTNYKLTHQYWSILWNSDKCMCRPERCLIFMHTQTYTFTNTPTHARAIT